MTRTFLLILALLACAVPASATTYVGASASVASSGTTCTIAYSPTPGNSVAIVASQQNSTAQTYTVADNGAAGGNVYRALVAYAGATANEQILLWDTHNVVAATSIVVTASGSQTYNCFAVEWSGAPVLDPAGAGAGSCLVNTGSCDTFENGAVLDIYGSNNAGGTIDTSANALVSAGHHGPSANGGYTAGTATGGSSYTAIVSGTLTMVEYVISGGAITDEHGHATQAATRRAQASFVAAWAPAAAAGNAGRCLLLMVC